MPLRHFVALLFVLAGTAFAVEFPGSWNNGKDEFKTIAISLRADGQAVFHTAVLPAPARWRKNDTGLDLTIGGGGQSLTLPFTYDAAAATLTARWQGDTLVLTKVSDQEPPDMLALARKRQAEDYERWGKQFRMEEQTLADVAAVRALLTGWLATPPDQTHAETIFLRPSERLPTFTLRRFGPEKLFIDIPLEHRRAESPSGYPTEGRSATGDVGANLPLVFSLPEPMRERIQALGQKPGVTAESHAGVQVSAFETESLYRYTQVIMTAADPTTPAVIDELMATLWPAPPASITATLHFRVPDNRSSH